MVIPMCEEDGVLFECTHNDLSFEVVERPILPVTKLQQQDLFNVARYLYPRYSRGFTWSELPYLIQEVLLFVAPNPEMSRIEKEDASIQTLHYIMVAIDSLYLPEKATHPFFEELLPPFINLALSFPKEKDAIQPSREELHAEENLPEYITHLSLIFKDGFNWKELADATRYALTYLLSYGDLSVDEQGANVIAILESLITTTPAAKLPPHFDEKLFEEFLAGYIACILQQG